MGLLVLTACGDDAPGEDDGGGGPPEPIPCAVGEVTLDDGTCRRPGQPLDACAEGFAAGLEICEPILPAAACPEGSLALLGETECRAIVACGAGPWGDIPVDATTVYVDTAATGGDGSAGAPFATIQQGIDAAAPGAIVAIAEGTYAEDLSIANKAVQLWGRCPELVSVAGSATAAAAIDIRAGASGTAVRALAVTSGAWGVLVLRSTDVILDGLWVHDAAGPGVDVEQGGGILASNLLVERSVGAGFAISGASAVIEGAAIRDITPLGAAFGRGLILQDDMLGQPTTATVTRTVVERTHEIGVSIEASEVTLERVVVRDIAPLASGFAGRGISAQLDPATGARAIVTVSDTLVDRCHDIGLLAAGSDVIVQRTAVRSTQAQPMDGKFGRGLSLQVYPPLAARASASVTATTVLDNLDSGVFVHGSDATFDGLWVARTLPRALDGYFGRGISIQDGPDAGERSVVTLVNSASEANADFGALVTDSDATVDNVRFVGATSIMGDLFGDGIVVQSSEQISTAVIRRSLVEANPRAGVVGFDANVSLGTSVLRCNGIDLNGEGVSFSFEDLGGNSCGCGSDEDCKVVSSVLDAADRGRAVALTMASTTPSRAQQRRAHAKVGPTDVPAPAPCLCAPRLRSEARSVSTARSRATCASQLVTPSARSSRARTAPRCSARAARANGAG
jgi:hypothetical protein